MKECNVIGDLLPLYVDKACSGRSAALVEAHLQSCESCKKRYGELCAKAEKARAQPEFDGSSLLRRRCRTLIAILFTVTAVIACYAGNVVYFFMGASYVVYNLCSPLAYISFWSIFTILAREDRLLAGVSYVVSLLTFLSAVYGLVYVLLGSILPAQSFFALIFLAAFIPFIGLFDFLGAGDLAYILVFVAAAAVSLVWLLYTRRHCRKFKTAGSPEREEGL